MKINKRSKSPSDVDRLYEAIEAYVENRGGKLVAIGGVEIQKRHQDCEFVFRVAVKCTGSQPQMPRVERKLVDGQWVDVKRSMK